jgi:hypothetical protein
MNEIRAFEDGWDRPKVLFSRLGQASFLPNIDDDSSAPDLPHRLAPSKISSRVAVQPYSVDYVMEMLSNFKAVT